MSHKLAAKFTTTMATLRDRREAGATGLEYAGMIAVALLVVGAIVGGVKAAGIEGKVTGIVNELLAKR